MDEQKKKMLMIGGAGLLAVVVIIALVMAMKHKKKVETSPMIVHTTSGPIVVPAKTPTTTHQLMTYIKSSKDGSYLVLNAGQQLTTSKTLSGATPVSIGLCSEISWMKEHDNDKPLPTYCLMTLENEPISVSSGNIVNYGNGNYYFISVSSTTGPVYLNIVGKPSWYLDTTSLGFNALTDAKSWMVVVE